MNEHTAPLNDVEGPYKRQRIGDGVALILAKESNTPFKYVFDAEKYSYDEAVEYAQRLGVDTVINAKLSMKASNGRPEIDGRIWSSGMHHVFVNDKPAKVYVPEETIMNTFNSIRELIDSQGRMPIGIDHLSDDVIANNEILAKMNLLDVGSVSKVGTDGQSIYILDSELTNNQIRELNSVGALPSYSIVGGMDARPCPTGKADYIVNSIDVERVDIVEEGGCQVCKVGAQPDNLILTSKKSMEEDIMVEANEAPVEETSVDELKEDVEEVVEDVKDLVDDVKEDVEEIVEDVKEVEDDVVEVVDDEADALKKKVEELEAEIKKLGGKKPKVEAGNAEAEVIKLIQAGKALPKMKSALIATYEADPEAFAQLAASMPKMVTMETKAKLAKVQKEERESAEAASADADMKELAKRFFKVDLD